MTTEQQVIEAIKMVSNGFPTRYIKSSGKTIRISDHGANPDRTDDDTISLVVDNNDQSFRSDRGRTITNWERSNQWYVNSDGDFQEQFESISAFLDWFEID